MYLAVALSACALFLWLYGRLPAGPEQSAIPLRLRWELPDAIFLMLAFSASGWLCLPVLGRFPDDQRLFQLFSPDFAQQILLIGKMVEEGRMDLGVGQESGWNFSYGCLQINLSILTCGVLRWFHPISTQVIALVHAGWLFLGLWATQAILYWWGRRLAGRMVGFSAAVLYLFPYKAIFCVVHACSPDHLQQPFLMVTLLGCAVLMKEPNLRRIVGPAFCAGMAFGVKYGGLFAFPLIIAALFATPAGRAVYCRPRRLLVAGVLALVVFGLGFATASPQAVLHPGTFVGALTRVSNSLAYGAYFADGVVVSYLRLFWDSFLRNDSFLLAIIILGAGGWVVAVRQLNSEDGRFLSWAAGAWLCLFGLVLLIRLRYYEAGIFFPTWPVLALAAAYGLLSFGRLGGWFFYQQAKWVPQLVSLLLLVALVTYEFRSPKAAFLPSRADRPLLFNLPHPFYSGVRELAAFLESRYPSSVAVVADHSQIYVPSQFGHVASPLFVLLNKLSVEERNKVGVWLLSRRDRDFEDVLRMKYYDETDARASWAVYRGIRTGRRYRKVAEFEYPSGWFGASVEVWERVDDCEPSEAGV